MASTARGRAPAAGLPPLEDLLWIDLPASGLDAAGFVAAVHGWRLARADAPVVVVGHDLAWRDDAGALLRLWDAASTSDGRLCAILTAPGLPNEPRLRSALLEASLVGVHRLDSHADAVILADYLNQPLADGVEAHGITAHDHSNVLPIAEAEFVVEDERRRGEQVCPCGHPQRVPAIFGAPQAATDTHPAGRGWHRVRCWVDAEPPPPPLDRGGRSIHAARVAGALEPPPGG